ncbi:MAG: aldo/keto reductase [Alphaproteobacteria bacterium]|nr:aldo/keto reductase [Alphaproteobacteria bacterium]
MQAVASRRRVLALGAGFAATSWLPAPSRAQTGPTALITRPIPHSGEPLPVIGLGTSQVFEIGDDPAQRQACAEVLKTLVSAGGKLIDTAPSYGTAERVVGDLLAATGLGGRVFLATKLEDYDQKTAAAQLSGSLQRLRTNRVDLMQLHNVRDPHQELAILREWKSQGYCRYFGITTSFGGDFAAVEAVVRREKPDFLQVNYSLGDRAAEKRVIPAAAELGAAVLTDLPFARNRLFRAVRGQKLPEWAAEFDAASWGQFFLKYLLGNEAVTAVIPGTSNPEHMADNLGAGHGRLPDAAQRQRMVAFFEALR